MFPEGTYSDIDRAMDEAPAAFVMDETTFRAFYDRNARGLWTYLARVTGDRSLADDLLQETFYRFLRAGADYESETHCRNSLYRIATNLARDARRRSLVRGPFSVAGHDIERVPSGHDAGAAERKTDLTRAMARLKPRERAMLWLAYAEGASHTEIADVLGLRPASLKSLLFRARRKLAGLMGRAMDGSE
ncbi:MAG: sigma-70 family RNA polymerase sigma factor [Bryobacteraceae bacterium]|jgi:RNA polymerase sigma-70 factor (ECF subfamily)